MRVVMWIMLVICLLTTAQAISLQMNFCNSDDTLSMDLSGTNLDFDASAELQADSVFYSNGGSSTDPECSYSYALTLNGQTLESGAETNSGSFSWHASADSNYKGDGSMSLALATKSAVKNGILEDHCSNSNIKVDEMVKAAGAGYSQQTRATPDNIILKGAGGTLSSNQITDLAEVHQIISMSGDEKSGNMESNVRGDTKTYWTNGITADDSKCTFGTAIRGISNNPVDGNNHGMEGQVSGFPIQSLPPGKVRISYTTEDEIEMANLLADFNNRYNEFKTKYPEPPTNALEYYLVQKAFVDPIEDEPTDGTQNPAGNYYLMSMGFDVRGY